jgi:hypothetical protein
MEKIEWRPIEEPEVKWLGVDFDGTICYSSGHPDYIPGEPIPGAVETLKDLDRQGYKITIFTARHWADYHNIERYLENWGIPFRRIICGKPLLSKMIDDRNVEFDGDWSKIRQKLIK